ncbi:XTH1 [Symbiodinium pilosum]|uniref:XTH1 protein n=1 Tax=Symbiodinium pilosum TaxID=2952 RepID=A0A812PKB5_SYMPI|nr:XTH1 [Symbiodinium pilosum]
MAPASLRVIILVAICQSQGAVSCDCSWTNNGEYCSGNDGTHCWSVCCPNSCSGGGWTVAYSAQRCQMSNGVRRISCDGPSMHTCGMRLTSSNYVGRGYHSVRIKAAPGPGVVTTFYLSNNGGLYDKTKTHPWVELDFEIMGNMAGPGGQSRIWTNMFTDIAVEHNQWIIVPFDVTADYHEFGFELGDNSISFKVDGVPYRTVDIQHHEDVRSSIWSTSLQEFVSVWGQSSQDPGEGIPEFQNALGLLDSIPNGFPRYAEVIM